METSSREDRSAVSYTHLTKIRIIVIWAPRASDGVQLHGLYAGTVISKHIINGLATDLTTKPTPTPATWVGYGPSVCIAHAA